ncbi:MAG: EI24 domain-containing protein [Planctomycetes bacterium]|nr:EI24 domain-containing protein [Planctomycetota bacterium]
MLRSLDGRTTMAPATRDGALDLLRGIGEVRRAMFALMHGKEFIGQLRLPVAMNAIAFVLVAGGGYWLLSAPFAAVFAQPWPLFDGVRGAHRDTGDALWLLVSWLLLGPPLLDLIAGAAQEPLRLATERRMLGSAFAPPPGPGSLRIRDRARLVAWLVLLWPVGLVLVLVPWLGLPAVALLGAAVAAIVWFEPPMASRGLQQRERLAAIRDTRWRCLGVGLGLQFAAFVPFLNVLGLAPVATLAATSAWLQSPKHRGAGAGGVTAATSG